MLDLKQITPFATSSILANGEYKESEKMALISITNV